MNLAHIEQVIKGRYGPGSSIVCLRQMPIPKEGLIAHVDVRMSRDKITQAIVEAVATARGTAYLVYEYTHQVFIPR